MEGLTQAVIYCRVSSDKQVRDGHGLDGQQARCASYARERGLDVVKVFRDEAISGRLENRPAFNELINFIEASEDSYVVVIDDLNRLARDVVVSRALKLLIKGSGSTLACVNFEFEDSPENNYFETIVVATGEYERRKNRQRVMSRQRARLEAGYWVFAPPRGYRYEKIEGHGKLLVPDEPNANLIHDVISKFASGELMTLTDARDFLEDGGLRNRSGKAICPTVEETKRILSRLIYAGYIEYKPWKVAEVVGHHEALVERGTFDAVQQRLAGRARAPTRSDLAKDFPLRSAVALRRMRNAPDRLLEYRQDETLPVLSMPEHEVMPGAEKEHREAATRDGFSAFFAVGLPTTRSGQTRPPSHGGGVA